MKKRFIDPKTKKEFEAVMVETTPNYFKNKPDSGWLVPLWVTSLPKEWIKIDN